MDIVYEADFNWFKHYSSEILKQYIKLRVLDELNKREVEVFSGVVYLNLALLGKRVER